MPLVEAVLSSLLFDGSDVDASRRSCVVISSLLMADASRCCDALGACRDAEQRGLMNPTLLLLRVGRPSDEAS